MFSILLQFLSSVIFGIYPYTCRPQVKGGPSNVSVFINVVRTNSIYSYYTELAFKSIVTVEDLYYSGDKTQDTS